MADFIHVNLLPVEYRVVKKDYSWVLDVRVVVPVLVLIGAIVGYLTARSFFASSVASKQTELQSVQAEIDQNAYVAEKIHELERLRDDKNAKNNALKSISVSKRKWVRIMEGLNKSLPLNMWLEGVKQGETGAEEMEIRGKTLVFPEIAQYMIELGKNEYFSKVSLGSIELQKEEDKSSFVFTLRITLNPNVGIDRLVEGAGKDSYL